MASLNKVLLLGNLGNDPELKATAQSHVCSFSLATTESWTKDGQKQEQTEWHFITVWGKLAEHCAAYLKKGSKALVEGSIKNESYVKNGEKKYTTKIVAQKVVFLDTKGDSAKKVETSAAPSAPIPDDLMNLPF